MAEVQVNGIPFFKDMKTYDINRLHHLFTDVCKNYKRTHIKVSRKAADLLECKNVTEFTATTEYIIRQIEREVTEEKKNDSNPNRPLHTKVNDIAKGTSTIATLSESPFMK
jgi:hypothetical protein